jgi:tetratricopeptide (TPR) repeat protein
MGKIFISYRRSDSADVSGRIFDKLVAEFYKDEVFKDVDSIPVGADFKVAVTEAVSQSDVVLVIMGQQWLTASVGSERRLDDSDDMVRHEIETALAHDVPLIPVLVQHAAMPRARELPSTMASFAYRNGVQVRPDPDFHRDMERLIEHLPHTLTGPRYLREGDIWTGIDVDRALEFLGRAVEQMPTSTEAWAKYGRALHEAKRFQESLEAYERAIDLDAMNNDAWFGKGHVLRAMGQNERALAWYESLLTRFPRHQYFLMQKSAILHNLGRTDEAKAADALAFPPHDPFDSIVRLAARNRTNTSRRKRQPNK